MVFGIERLYNPSIEQSIENRDISEVVYNVQLTGLANFVTHTTAEFFVSGNPWHIKFIKTSKNNQNSLGVYLCSDALFLGRIDKLIAATSTFELLPQQMIQEPHKHTINVIPFSTQTSIWGHDEFITWDELVNPVNGYSVEDKCEFKIIVKATPLVNAAQNEWLTFEDMTVRDDIHYIHKKLRMTIHEIHNVIGVCSPNIQFNGCLWQIVVEQSGDLILVTIYNSEKRTCRVSCKITLKSVNPNIEPITTGTDGLEFNLNSFFASWNLITMEDLVDLEKQFLLNGESFNIEVDLKADNE